MESKYLAFDSVLIPFQNRYQAKDIRQSSHIWKIENSLACLKELTKNKTSDHVLMNNLKKFNKWVKLKNKWDHTGTKMLHRFLAKNRIWTPITSYAMRDVTVVTNINVHKYLTTKPINPSISLPDIIWDVSERVRLIEIWEIGRFAWRQNETHDFVLRKRMVYKPNGWQEVRGVLKWHLPSIRLRCLQSAG